MDTIIKFIAGVRVYFLTAIDAKLKFAFSLPYGKLNSRNTVDFFKKLQAVYPITIITVQTDNGLEFLGEFDEYLEKQNIPRVFIYPGFTISVASAEGYCLDGLYNSQIQSGIQNLFHYR